MSLNIWSELSGYKFSIIKENELVNMNELLASQTDRVNKRMMVEKPKRMKNR